MEPELLIRVTASGICSVEIHSSSEQEEQIALSLYDRLKPGIRVFRALLLDCPSIDKSGQDVKAEPQA